MRRTPRTFAYSRSGKVARSLHCGVLAAGAAAMLPGAALAQAAGTVAPPTREQLTPEAMQPAEREGPTLTVDGQMERRPCALDNAQYADLMVTLDAVRFTGAERASDVALGDAYRGYLGRQLPVRALCDIRDRATVLLEAAGYLAAVEIPAQNLGDGEAELAVVLGRLVAIRARGDTGTGNALLEAYLGKLVGQDVFRVDDAERYLLLANDIPGASVRLSLRPAAGGQPGDLVGEVAVLRRDYMVDLTLQNLGSRALGRYSAIARGEAYNLTGLGDATSLSVFTSLDFVEQQTVQLGHELRLGSEGLTLGGRLTFGWTKPDALPGFTIESDTMLAAIDGRYPFIRAQAFSLWGAAGIDLVDQDVTINTVPLSRDRVRTAWMRTSFDAMDRSSIARRDGYSPYEPRLRALGLVELRQGLDLLSASPDCRGLPAACLAPAFVPPSRIEQNPTPLFVRGQFAAQFRPTPLVALKLQVRGQFSGTTLPAFEQFSAGNFSIGRGFDPSALVGDAGLGASFELAYGSLRPQSPHSLAIQPYLFTDAARVWQKYPGAAALDLPDRLWSGGAGLRFAYGPLAFGDLTLAVPLHDDGITAVRDVRALFTISARLSPWRSR